VNAASNLPDPLASFTWVTLHGTALSNIARARTPEDVLPGFGGVDVLVNYVPALLCFVSPTQVTFLLPPGITTPEATIRVTRWGTAGPLVKLPLSDSSPALFQMDQNTVVAAHPDWTVVTAKSPAHGGEYAILYATGLGPFVQPLDDTEAPPKWANPIQRRPEFTLLLDGVPVEDRLVEYAGAAPLLIGLYQINLKLPEKVNKNPEIRIGLGQRLSPPGVHLIVQ
jgi:uncharacterized protein (TIGR03437 family)